MIKTEPQVALNGRYTVCDIAEILQVSRNTVTRYCQNGSMRCGFNRYNRRRFVLGSEILRFWRSHL